MTAGVCAQHARRFACVGAGARICGSPGRGSWGKDNGNGSAGWLIFKLLREGQTSTSGRIPKNVEVYLWLNLGLNMVYKIQGEAMATVNSVQEGAKAALFDTVADDHMSFWEQSHFQPSRVTDFLRLEKRDVSRIASVSDKSVRYDDKMPEAVRDRLEEIANIVNLVAGTFQGDITKTSLWFKTQNPILGDVSPRDMIRLGRYDRLRKYVVEAALMNRSARQSGQASRKS